MPVQLPAFESGASSYWNAFLIIKFECNICPVCISVFIVMLIIFLYQNFNYL